MAIFDTIFSSLAGIGGSFLQAEIQRKAQRRSSKLGGVGFPFDSMPGIGALGNSRNGVLAPTRRSTPVGTSSSFGPVTNPSAWTDRRKWKAALCRAVKGLEVHPAQATALLKMEGLKGCTRRMNPLNPRALTRAARRMEGFLRTVKRIEKAIPTKTRKVRVKEGHHHHPAAGGG